MRTLTAFAATSVASLALAGCGGEREETTASGKGASTTDSHARRLFVDTCGSCHALNDAATQGSVGPPLNDTTLAAEAIARQIEMGVGAMPPNLLQGDDKEAVARYVAEQAKVAKSRSR